MAVAQIGSKMIGRRPFDPKARNQEGYKQIMVWERWMVRPPKKGTSEKWEH
jgi:hypothetical protein